MFRIVFAAALLCVPSIAYAETCIASHYGVGDGYGGRRTANGENHDPACHDGGAQDAAFLSSSSNSSSPGP